MRDLTVLSVALEHIEQRLCEPMNAADLAKACFVSYSGLQKLFGYVFHGSIGAYITKRRLSQAAAALLTSDDSITNIAYAYQYESPEAFARAFRRFWGITPSAFRKTRRFSGLQPKFKLENDNGGISMTMRKPMDVSELYDELKKLGGTYALSIDIVNFEKTNADYGYAAGDIVIAAAFARIEQSLSEDMLLFRTGGDEFAVVTALDAPQEAEALARKIVADNGKPVKAGADDVPLSLRIGVSQIPQGSLHYRKALARLEDSVNHVRETSDFVAVYGE